MRTFLIGTLMVASTTVVAAPPTKDVVFAKTDSGDLQLDLFLPKQIEYPPLVVFIHGGGWRNNSYKKCLTPWLTEHGFAVASIGYRLTDKATFPAQIHDCKAAIRWLRAHAKDYGYDATRIGVAGTSAGGHLATLLGTTTSVKELEGSVGNCPEQSSQVHAIVDYYGPTDFVLRSQNQPQKTEGPDSPVCRLLGGPARENVAAAKLASPAFHVTKDDPPLLILHGENDKTVYLDQSQRIMDEYRKRDLSAKLVVVPKAGHGGGSFFTGEYRQQVVAFLDQHLRANASEAKAGVDQLDPKQAQADDDGKKLWYDIRSLGLEGQGWSDTLAPFDRLPGKAQKIVRGPVWSLSRHSAGLCVRFVTDATEIHARWTLTSKSLAMPHMPATGVSGVDLYVRHEGKWRWLAVGRPKAQTNAARLASGLPAGTREYLLYLPLYNGVTSVELGVPKSAKLMKAPARSSGQAKPIVFYGTSITQGGCASRPGMVHTAILGRWLNRPVINLGFSGNGRMEMEVADLLAELDPAVYVIDCLPNITADDVRKRTEPLVERLRKARPDTPILLVEDRNYTDSFLNASKRERNQTSQAELKQAYHRLQEAGVKQLYYLPGAELLGDDGEGTVDSSHPTDLGFLRQAEAFRPVLEKILAQPAGQ